MTTTNTLLVDSNHVIDPTLWLILTLLGALAFGFVIGWITYRTLRYTTTTGLTDIATVLGAVGGAAVTGLFDKASGAFGAYCIGLFLGFIGYLTQATKPNAPPWLGPVPVVNQGQAPAQPVVPPLPPPANPGGQV